MGVESVPEQSRIPIESSDMISPHQSAQSSDFSSGDQVSTGFRARARHVSPCMRFAIFTILLTLLASFASANPLYFLMFVFLAILPAGIVAKFIMTTFKDDAVSEKFLINQFLIGAIPLPLIVVLIEVIFGTIFLLMIFSHELSIIAESLGKHGDIYGRVPANATAPGNTAVAPGGSQSSSVRLGVWRFTLIQPGERGKTLPESMAHIAPAWKLILFLLLSAFLVAGFVEETGKWFVSRRYRKINSDPSNVELGRKVGCKGILAACSMGALGFATSENLIYAVSLSATPSVGFPFSLVALALLRGVLAFPFHVGAQCYVGVSTAQNFVFNDNVRILYALLIAILLHGTFDAAALIVGLFVSAKWWPDWSTAFGLVFQVGLVILLMILCRGRYKALLERERLILPQDGV